MGHEKDAGIDLALYLEMKYVQVSGRHLLHLKKNQKAD